MSNLTERGWGWGVRLQLPSVRKNMPSVPGSTDLLSCRTTGAASRHYLSLSSRLACRPPPSLLPPPPAARHKERRGEGGIKQFHWLPAARWHGQLILLLSAVCCPAGCRRSHPGSAHTRPCGCPSIPWRKGGGGGIDAAPHPFSALVILPCCHYLLCRWPPKNCTSCLPSWQHTDRQTVKREMD